MPKNRKHNSHESSLGPFAKAVSETDPEKTAEADLGSGGGGDAAPEAKEEKSEAPPKARPRRDCDMQIARYFALGVEKTRDGEFVAGKSDEVLSAQSAVKKARSIAHQTGGAVAFEWRGDVEFGRSGSIEILAAFGELPPEVKGLMREA